MQAFYEVHHQFARISVAFIMIGGDAFNVLPLVERPMHVYQIYLTI